MRRAFSVPAEISSSLQLVWLPCRNLVLKRRTRDGAGCSEKEIRCVIRKSLKVAGWSGESGGEREKANNPGDRRRREPSDCRRRGGAGALVVDCARRDGRSSPPLSISVFFFCFERRARALIACLTSAREDEGSVQGRRGREDGELEDQVDGDDGQGDEGDRARGRPGPGQVPRVLGRGSGGGESSERPRPRPLPRAGRRRS